MQPYYLIGHACLIQIADKFVTPPLKSPTKTLFTPTFKLACIEFVPSIFNPFPINPAVDKLKSLSVLGSSTI